MVFCVTAARPPHPFIRSPTWFSKDTGGNKVQRPIYSCCSDRSIRSYYHTHKVALSRARAIPNQPEQRSRLLLRSFLWSRATVWYAEDAPLTVIAEDNYLRLTWREIRGAPAGTDDWLICPRSKWDIPRMNFHFFFPPHQPPSLSFTFNSTSMGRSMQGWHAIGPSACHTLPLLCPFYITLSHSSVLVLSPAANLSSSLHV